MRNRILHPRYGKTAYALRNASTHTAMARTPAEREQDRLNRLGSEFLRPKKLTTEQRIEIQKEAAKTPAEREAERLWLQAQT